MNKGRIENFGKPYDLLNDDRTILNGLVNSLEKSEKEKLIEMARKAYENSRKDYSIEQELPQAYITEDSKISTEMYRDNNLENESLLPKNV